MHLLTTLKDIVGKRVVDVRSYDRFTRIVFDDDSHVVLEANTTGFGDDAEIDVVQHNDFTPNEQLGLEIIGSYEFERVYDKWISKEPGV